MNRNTQHSGRSSFRWRGLVWRGLWLVMAVGHVPALFATVGDGRWGSAAVLFGSEVFFLLKLLDVWYLRLPSGRRSMLASATVLLLLHAPVLTQAVVHADQPAPWHLMVVGAGAAACVAVFVRRNNRIAGVKPHVVRINAHNEIARCVHAMLAALLPPRFVLRRSCLIDRSPPSWA